MVSSSDSTHLSLLQRAKDPNDRAAWRQFEERYGPLIVSYCHRLGLQLADAEDIRQQVMFGLSKALPGFEYQPERGRFRSYLGRAVRNAMSLHFGRHRLRGGSLLNSDALEQVSANQPDHDDERWEHEWAMHHCRLALHTLRQTADAKHMEVFERLLAGRSPAEVAGEFQMTAETVRKIKQRIRERLQEIVARQLRDENSSHA